jgi:hypothetical protein
VCVEVLYCDPYYDAPIVRVHHGTWWEGYKPAVRFFGAGWRLDREWSYMYIFEEGTTREEQERQAQVLMDLINSSTQGE